MRRKVQLRKRTGQFSDRTVRLEQNVGNQAAGTEHPFNRPTRETENPDRDASNLPQKPHSVNETELSRTELQASIDQSRLSRLE
ncbi:hypothetical protein RRG08_052423 [Elysia crispata]|uniref:Uncharacterized protein n=1 Tax=Elysia crispata TaxID=231223 RepID=A0AAE1B1G3_9GAST|nr:hypothetical protein RRG08_052423 [Elysia crispata]